MAENVTKRYLGGGRGVENPKYGDVIFEWPLSSRDHFSEDRLEGKEITYYISLSSIN